MMQRMLFTLSLVGMAAASTAGCQAFDGFVYEANSRPIHGDVCRDPITKSWFCPSHCERTVDGVQPFCYMEGTNDVCRPSETTACPDGTVFEDHTVTGHNDVCRVTDGSGNFMCPSHCDLVSVASDGGSEGYNYCSFRHSGGRPCRLIDVGSLAPAGCPAGSERYEAHSHPDVGDVCRTSSNNVLCPTHCESAPNTTIAICQDIQTGQPCRADSGLTCSEGFTYEPRTESAHGDVCRVDGSVLNWNCPAHCVSAGRQSPYCYYQGSENIPCRLYEATFCPKGTYESHAGNVNHGDVCRGGYICPRGCSLATGQPYCQKTGTESVCRAKTDHCNWQCYLDRHSDLVGAFGTNLVAAEEHYETWGQYEERDCTCPAE